MHLRDIHLLRGAAIVLVVAVHCTQSIAWREGDWQAELMNVIFWDGSGVFFMVAGFLFQHLSRKFDYRDYLWRKLTNVLLPFALVSIPGIVHTLGYLDLPRVHPELVDLPKWMLVAFLYAYPGEQYNYPLWFIPVMATYFLMAPAFIWLLRRPNWFLMALGVFCVYSLLHARPSIVKYQHISLTLYWMSSYMLGMAASLYRDKVAVWVDRYHLVLWATWVVIIFVQFAWLGDGSGDRFKANEAHTRLTLNLYFIQKAILFFALMALFRRFQHRRLAVVDTLATWSFPIFFLHAYFLQAIFKSKFGIPLQGSILNLTITTVVVIAFSLALTVLTQKLFGVKSRYILGA
jgi:probable poly-beta-1,6-N-acetyl-D-glucosamine export protein